MVEEIERCSGHCCRNFALPYNYDTIKKMKEECLAADPNYVKNSNLGGTVAADIFDMLIYIGTDSKDCNGDDFKGEVNHYTCKNFDTQTGNCKDYNNRPIMCRSYPSRELGGVCGYKGCTRKVKVTEDAQNIVKAEAKDDICG